MELSLARLAALAGMTLVNPIVEADDEPKDDKPTDFASALAAAKSVKLDVPKDKDGNDLPARLKITYEGGTIYVNASGDKASLEFEDAPAEEKPEEEIPEGQDGKTVCVKMHKAFPGKVAAAKAELEKQHNSGDKLKTTEDGDYVSIHVPKSGANTKDSVERTMKAGGHAEHHAYGGVHE